MAAEQVEITEEMSPAWWPMIGVHAGLMAVCFGALYTKQVQGAVDTSEYAGYALVGLALLLLGVVRKWDLQSTGARATLALGGAMALGLAWEPQLSGLPGGGVLLATPIAHLQPSVAHLGVLLAGIFLGLQIAVDRRLLPREVPFRRALVAAVVLLLAMMGVMWLGLRNVYDLSMTSSPSVLVFRALAYGLLMLICLTVPGRRAVRGAPHIYLGLTLLAAVARNIIAG